MLNLKELFNKTNKSKELKLSEKKQKLLLKRLKVLNDKIAHLTLKDYENQKKKLGITRARYIQFLKDNNLWTKDMEEKYNLKKLKHPLRMSKFDEDYVKRLAKQRLNKEYKDGVRIGKGRMYGDAAYENFVYYTIVMDITEEVCRINNWTSRSDWKEKGVPINKLVKEFYHASLDYAEIKKYYAKMFYDERTKMHTK